MKSIQEKAHETDKAYLWSGWNGEILLFEEYLTNCVHIEPCFSLQSDKVRISISLPKRITGCLVSVMSGSCKNVQSHDGI